MTNLIKIYSIVNHDNSDLYYARKFINLRLNPKEKQQIESFQQKPTKVFPLH